MAFKIVGVQAVVRGAGKFLSDIQAVTKATTDSSKKITLALQREEARRRRIWAQTQEQMMRYDKLKDKQGELSASSRKVNAQIDLLLNTFAKSTLKTERLTAALGTSGKKLASFSGIVKQAGPIVAGIALQFKFWGAMLKIMLAPLKLYIKAIGKWIDLFKKLVQTGVKVIGFVVDLAKKIGGILLARLKTLLSVVTRVGQVILSGLGNALKSIASSAINIATAALRKLGDVLKDVIKLAWEGAATFQKLAIRFQGLVANEIIATGRADDFGTAMAMASREGAELLQWIQQLAVTTPFTRRDISETVAFSMAMGFTSRQTKEMTLAIGNFVSGMGLSSDVMERIILQFGQMQAGGRLYGTELRDLARGAFVPVNDIIKKIADNLGMTAKEWQDLAARGETDIQPFFDEFINMANTRFPNAMERMNTTLEAVTQNIKEFVTEFLGVKLFLPSVQRLSEAISSAFKQITTPTTMKAFELAGKSVGHLTNTLINLLKVIGQTVLGTKDLQQVAVNIAAFISVAADKVRRLLVKATDWVKGLSVDFGTMAKDALKWGVDVMTNFAIGLVNGASTALVTAMNAISGMLAWWLQSFSPPRVAPDIIKWGAAAMTEYLRGFTEGDFTILKDIQSPLKSALDIMVSRGQIDDKEMRKSYIKISQGLIKGLSGGGIGAGTFTNIGRIGEFGAEINRLIKLELNLVAATERVKQAEEALEASRRRHTAAVLDVRKQTMEYNKLLRGGAGQDVLDAQLKRVNAAELEREAAAEQIGVDEKRLQAAQDALGPIEEMVSLQKQLIDQLLELARMSIAPNTEDAISAAKGLGGAIEDVANAVDDLDAKVKGAMQGQGGLSQAFEDAKERISKAWSNLFEGVGKKWKEQTEPHLKELKKMWEKFKKTVIFPVLDALGIKHEGASHGLSNEPSELENRLVAIKERATELWTFWKDDLKSALTEFFKEGGVLDELTRSFGDLMEAVSNLASTLGFGGEGGGEGQGPLTQAIAVVGGFITWLMDYVLTPFLTKLDSIITKLIQVRDWFVNVKSAWSNAKQALGEAALGAVGLESTPGSEYPRHQKGAWRLPSSGLRFLHEGEMILPPDVSSAIRSSLTSPVSAMPVSNTVNNNVQFGDVSVGSQMDMAMLQIAVEGALRNAL